MDKLSYVLFALIMVLIFTLVFWNDLTMIFANPGIFVAVISIMIVAIALIVFINYKKDKKEYELRQKIEKAQDRLSRFIITNKSGNQITISKRDVDWKYFLPIEKMSNTKVKYNPASITYTSVTIGGITTGSVNYEDEHLSMVSSKRTGKAMLKCVNFTDAYYVHKITLTGEALEDAKKSSTISLYLNNDTISLSRDSLSPQRKKEIGAVAKYSDIGVASNVINQAAIDNALSYNEIDNIVSWLCGN